MLLLSEFQSASHAWGALNLANVLIRQRTKKACLKVHHYFTHCPYDLVPSVNLADTHVSEHAMCELVAAENVHIFVERREEVPLVLSLLQLANAAFHKFFQGIAKLENCPSVGQTAYMDRNLRVVCNRLAESDFAFDEFQITSETLPLNDASVRRAVNEVPAKSRCYSLHFNWSSGWSFISYSPSPAAVPSMRDRLLAAAGPGPGFESGFEIELNRLLQSETETAVNNEPPYEDPVWADWDEFYSHVAVADADVSGCVVFAFPRHVSSPDKTGVVHPRRFDLFIDDADESGSVAAVLLATKADLKLARGAVSSMLPLSIKAHDPFGDAKAVPRRLLGQYVYRELGKASQSEDTEEEVSPASRFQLHCPRILTPSLLKPASPLATAICSKFRGIFHDLRFECSRKRNDSVRFERSHEMWVRWSAGCRVSKKDLSGLRALQSDTVALRVIPIFSKTLPVGKHIPAAIRCDFINRMIKCLLNDAAEFLSVRYLRGADAGSILIESITWDSFEHACTFVAASLCGRAFDMRSVGDDWFLGNTHYRHLRFAALSEDKRRDLQQKIVELYTIHPSIDEKLIVITDVPGRPHAFAVMYPTLGHPVAQGYRTLAWIACMRKAIRSVISVQEMQSLSEEGLSGGEDSPPPYSIATLDKGLLSMCLSICSDTVYRAVELPCGHLGCFCCIHAQLEHLIASLGSFAPSLACSICCKFPSPFFWITLFQNDAVRVLAGRLSRPPNSFPCNTPDCGRLLSHYVPSLYSAVQTSFDVQCRDCNALHCANCRRFAHHGEDCDGKRFFRIMESGRTRTCPECRIATTRSDGCQHMACTCGANWCWLCGSVLLPEHIGRHKGLCHDDILLLELRGIEQTSSSSSSSTESSTSVVVVPDQLVAENGDLIPVDEF
eukprot:ANDGO_04896.mRNA.1 putative E3 ubiquitin-protein ligase ARI9